MPPKPARRRRARKKTAAKELVGGLVSQMAKLTTNTRMSAPLATGSSQVYNGPVLRARPNGNTIVSNLEYLTDINSSATAGAENSGAILFNVRNATNLPWLSGFGQRYQEYRVLHAHVKYQSAVAATTNGDMAIALVYDVADTTGVTIPRLQKIGGSAHFRVWCDSPAVKCQPWRDMPKPWYLSGTSAGTPSGNQQTAFTILYSAQSNLVSTLLGRLVVEFSIEFKDPVDIAVNA